MSDFGCGFNWSTRLRRTEPAPFQWTVGNCLTGGAGNGADKEQLDDFNVITENEGRGIQPA